MIAAVIIALIVLALLAVFQLALTVGAPLGRFAWGGQHTVLPVRFRIGSLVAIGIYLLMAALLASKAQFIALSLNETIVNVGLWLSTVYLAFGTVLNAISRSKPERYTMTPVAAVLAVCFLVAALHSSPAHNQTIDSFRACEDAGGVIMESYPEQCRIHDKTFVNGVQAGDKPEGYVGLTEQDALDKAKQEGAPARVVERDGAALPVTMDFVFAT